MPTHTCQADINAPIQDVWTRFTEPDHVTNWYHANDEWHAPRASNDLRVGGEFEIRMEAKDASTGFDFTGTYTEVDEPNKIAYEIADGRIVDIDFSEEDGVTTVTESFEAEDENSGVQQRDGWQAILDNFKKYCEDGE